MNVNWIALAAIFVAIAAIVFIIANVDISVRG